MAGVVGEAVEAAFGQIPRDAQETAPRGTRKRAADADATRAEFCEIGQGAGCRTPDQHVDRLGRDGRDNGLDLFGLARAWRVQAIGAGFGVGAQTLSALYAGHAGRGPWQTKPRGGFPRRV